MIDDPELAGLFREESEEHLQSLDDGLLALEKNPRDSATLQQVFRSAHSLKGAARMLGVESVETIAHHFEDALGSAARGDVTLENSTIERLYGALDALRALVREAIVGTPSGVSLSRVVDDLRGQNTGPTAAKSPENRPETSSVAASSLPEIEKFAFSPDRGIEIVAFHSPAPDLAREPLARDVPEPQIVKPEISPLEIPRAAAPLEVAAPDPAWKIETIRVEPSRLDALLAMAGELIVATTRARRGRGEFEDLSALWEEETKASQVRRRALGSLERALGRGLESGKSGEISKTETPKEAQMALRDLQRLAAREEERLGALGALISRLRAGYDEVAHLDGVAGEMEAAIRGVRLLPLSTLFALFPRLVRDLAKAQGKEVHFVMEGGETTADKRILEELKDPLMHMIRNAVDHGLEIPAEREHGGKRGGATLVLRAVQTATRVVIELRDDGRGLDEEAIGRAALRKGLLGEAALESMSPRAVRDLIFAPGFSTAAMITDVSGRGVGLDVVRANVEKLRGTIEVESARGQGTTFRLTLPVTLSTTRVLLVRVGEAMAAQVFALPVENVQSVQLIAPGAVFPLQGRASFAHNGVPVPILALSELLQLPLSPPSAREENAPKRAAKVRPCVVLEHGAEKLGVWVDAVIDEQEIILKPPGALLQNVANLAGATILDTGDVALVLQCSDLIQNATRLGQSRGQNDARLSLETAPDEVEQVKTVLLVEDSITTRTQEKRILEAAGYRVVVAVDGLDGWSKLAAGEFDCVVSDVEMPNMDGLALAQRIRQDEKYKELPIILVTSLSSEADRRRGVEVGANAYITKSTFEQKTLIDTVRRLT